jgi:hypothetical protein
MNNYYEVLKLKYLAEREEAKANLDLYFKSSIAIADHPDIIKTMDKLLNKFVHANDKLKNLEENFNEFIKH